MGIVVSLFSFVNSALTNVQKKRGQFKKCRVHTATALARNGDRPMGTVRVMIRISAAARARIVAGVPVSNRYLVDR
jgi:hypothetical protein